MSSYAKLALGVFAVAVVLLVLGEVVPMAHAIATVGGMSMMGLVIIVLLVTALGIVVRGNLKRAGPS
jgi:Mg2+/Co2+ transporter CorB